jgi:hypothetical protein
MDPVRLHIDQPHAAAPVIERAPGEEFSTAASDGRAEEAEVHPAPPVKKRRRLHATAAA